MFIQVPICSRYLTGPGTVPGVSKPGDVQANAADVTGFAFVFA